LLISLFADGVAPRAKMNQQRSRRFRSAQEAKQKDEDNEEFLKMLKSKNAGVVHEDAPAMAQKKTWDSNAITPGTPFMDILAASLKFWCKHKVNTDPAWQKVCFKPVLVPEQPLISARSKSYYRMLQYRVKESTRSWSSSGLSVLHQSTTLIPVMSYTGLMLI